jgi:hypothetical protein
MDELGQPEPLRGGERREADLKIRREFNRYRHVVRFGTIKAP